MLIVKRSVPIVQDQFNGHFLTHEFQADYMTLLKFSYKKHWILRAFEKVSA
jgi:hypothetical protein